MRLFRAERPDLVHAHMPISGFLARMAAWWAGVPRIAYTGHGFWFNFPGLLAAQRRRLRDGVAGGRVTDVFLTVSEAEARDARRLHIHRGAVAVGNGRDPARFQPDRRRPPADPRRTRRAGRSRWWWSPSRGWSGTRAIPNWPRRCATVPGATLWVVGERLTSDRGPDMAALLRDAGLGDRLRLLGYRDDVADLMAAADIFVLPSHFEGLPMSVIEAMLTGLPVVATECARPGANRWCRR